MNSEIQPVSGHGLRPAFFAWTLAAGCFLAFPSSLVAEELPGELKLILAPGSGRGDTIIFSPVADGIIRRESRRSSTTGLLPTVGQEAVNLDGMSRNKTADGGGSEIDDAFSLPAPDAKVMSPADGAVATAPSFAETLAYRPKLSVGLGYRVDNLNWTISGTNGTPNILSELDWEKVESAVLSTEYRWSNKTQLYFRGNFDAGLIFDGGVRDSDYLGDDRTYEFSRSYSDTTDGSLLDFSAAVGYRFDIPLDGGSSRLHLMPIVGYAYSTQDFDITNGTQVLSAYGFPVELGDFAGLDSSYDTVWKGPWVGLDLELRVGDTYSLTGSLSYYWLDYEAEADWNLRSDFAHPVSFRQDADGDGISFSLGYRYNLSTHWFTTINYTYRDFSTDRGNDTTYFSDGSTVYGLFNGASSDSSTLIFGFGYNF